jgi:hypothetical protein
MPRLIAAAVLAMMLAACTETPTDPDTTKAFSERPMLSVALPGTTASITSGSCSLVSASTGQVRCSYDIANPEGLLLNIYPGARLNVAYKCINAGTGKIQSSGSILRWAAGADVDAETATNPTATDVQLSIPTAPSGYIHKDSKINVCNGKQTTVVTNYSLVYWEVYIDNWYPFQPDTEYSYTCMASDPSYRGCATS